MRLYTSILGRTPGERETGASVVDNNFINIASALGHQLVVIVPDGRGSGVASGPAVTLMFSRFAGSSLIGRLAKVKHTACLLIGLYRSDPSGVFRVNSFFSSLLEVVPLLLYSRGRAQLFVQFHHKDHSRLRNFITRQVMRRARVIICPSRAARQELIELMGCAPLGLHMVHHGVDDKFFAARLPHSDEQSATGSPLRLLFVGHLERRKNPFALLALAKALYGQVPFVMVIVGKGPELAGLQAECCNQPWAATVSFLGEVSDEEKLKQYAQSDLFVFPSKQEGFGLVLCEAMACGLPVLAFNTSAMPEIVQTGTGYLVPIDDTAAMAEIVSRLARDRALLQELAHGAIRHAGTHFHWQQKVADICRHLDAAFRSEVQGPDSSHLDEGR